MKNFFLIVFFLAVAISLNAKNLKPNSIKSTYNVKSNYRFISDTLIPASFIDSSLGGLGCQSSVYPVDINAIIDSGYVSGTNIFNDLEKGQRYILSDFGYLIVTINKVSTHFGIIQPSDTSGFVFAKIYNQNSSGLPDSLLAVTDSINISDLAAAINGIAEFNFPSSLIISNSFVISVDFSNCLNDTLGIIHTESNCFETSGSAEERWNDGTWHSFNNSWQFETDLAIFPVISDGVLMNTTNILVEKQINVYPNPASNLINFSSSRYFENISVYDVSGRKIVENSFSETLNFNMDVSSFSNGLYFIKLDGKEINLNDRIVIIK